MTLEQRKAYHQKLQEKIVAGEEKMVFERISVQPDCDLVEMFQFEVKHEGELPQSRLFMCNAIINQLKANVGLIEVVV